MTWKAEEDNTLHQEDIYLFCLSSLSNSPFGATKLFQCGMKTNFDSAAAWYDKVLGFRGRLVFLKLGISWGALKNMDPSALSPETLM